MISEYALTVLAGMLLMHTVADFHLQGSMAELKQQKEWAEYSPKYCHDYLAALALHGLEWSLCLMLPVVAFNGWQVTPLIGGLILLNAGVHAVIDDLKCNRLRINLVQDQMLHLVQILATFTAVIV